ncbi:alpha/beta hydrolase [Pseudomonas lurida]|uniref:alpha/beta fold hydrolase n=1 Tax=Pseudomonas TaxID=286 RepID=UPI0015E4028F|nr:MULTISPECIES: alpha/beta hydrolase [Pseudomonas]MBA1292465.1 alpha/beta hydrolase [Pseudomonas lurida]
MKILELVCLPGFMLSDDLWSDLIPELPANVRVTCIDIRGTSIREMAEHVVVSAPPSFVICGFSMGGYVAREVVRLAPERVKGLIVIASSSRADTEQQISQKNFAHEQISKSDFAGLSKSVIAKGFGDLNRGNQRLVDRVQAMSIKLGKDVFLKQSQVVRESDLESLSSVSQPTLLIAADQDKLRSPEEMLEIAERIQGSEFSLIRESGHMIPLEQPKKLGEVISRWVNQWIAL